MRKRVFGHMWTAKSCAQTDLGFRCPLTLSFYTIECIMKSKYSDETLRMRGKSLNLAENNLFA